jgi:glutamate/tyrosine decarboxylase-like PLP-dependent enzyme
MAIPGETTGPTHAALLRDAVERAIRYLHDLPDRPVFPREEATNRLSELDLSLPDGPTDPRLVLALLDEIGSPATVASPGGRYFGYVIGGSLPAALAAHWLATAWDQNAVFRATSPVSAFVEDVALRWILEVLTLPPDWRGGFVTGTTMGHVAGLAAARHAVLERQGWDVERDGLFGAPPIRIVTSAHAHTTLFRAARLIGLGDGRIVRVPVDEQGRMIPTRLPELDASTILCAQAGNVDGGSFDPLPELVDAARASGAWIHLDAAFGLWARATPRHAQLLRGLEDVDSCAADLHKWLNVPYDNGVILVRGSAANSLRSALRMQGAYFPEEDARDRGRWTPDASRRARGVDAWAALLSLGRSGLADLVERNCGFARRFAEGLAAAGYSVLNDVVLNQVLVSFGSDTETQAVIEGIQADGTCWCSGTHWNGRAAMRISVCSWATTPDDVERSLESMLSIAERVRGGSITGAGH